jgi:hypothetical protein
VGAHAAGGVALRSVSNAAGNFLVENAFTSALGQAGIPVRSKPDSSAPVLEFEVVDLGLAYVDTHRRMLIGGQKVEREARARVFARLVGSGGHGPTKPRRARATKSIAISSPNSRSAIRPITPRRRCPRPAGTSSSSRSWSPASWSA